MKVALLSDIHGNLPALEKVVSNTKDLDSYLVLGDVVNYGPWSNECVEFLDNLRDCIKLKGNHEDYFINGSCFSNNHLAKEFFSVCFEGFNKTSLIKDYSDHHILGDFTCIHTIEGEYIFEDTDIKIEKNYIIGHSHQQYEKIIDKFKIINPGSVGQNRKFINEINYAVFDTKLSKIDFKQIIYDVDILISEMKKKNYPEICLDYYRLKDRK